MEPVVLVLVIIAAVIAFFAILLSLVPIGLWISAIAAGVKVGRPDEPCRNEIQEGRTC